MGFRSITFWLKVVDFFEHFFVSWPVQRLVILLMFGAIYFPKLVLVTASRMDCRETLLSFVHVFEEEKKLSHFLSLVFFLVF